MDAGDTEVKRKQVCNEQLTALVEFLKEHRSLAQGLNRGRSRGKCQSSRLWNQCAKKLNTIENGVSKDGKGWSKYWCDWKYRVKRHALELKLALDKDRTQLPDGLEPLTQMEENILNLIGVKEIEGVVICNNTYYEGLSEAERIVSETNDDNMINEYFEGVVAGDSPSVNVPGDSDGEYSEASLERRSSGASPLPPVSKPTIDAAQRHEGAKKRRSNGVMNTIGDGGKLHRNIKCVRKSKRRTVNKRLRSSDDENPQHDASTSESKPEVNITKNENHTDQVGEDKASMFLSLEREKISLLSNVAQSLGSINSEISRLVSVMSDIRDCLNKNAVK